MTLTSNPGLLRRTRDLSRDKHHSRALLHLPARHRVQRWGADRAPGTKIEAGMVPGTAYGFADDQPFGEWTTVMRADSPNGEPLWAPMNEENRLPSGMSSEHA
jgi:hypothetical protein